MNDQSRLYLESAATSGFTLRELLEEADLKAALSLLNPDLCALIESDLPAIAALKARAPEKWHRTKPEGPLVVDMQERVLVKDGRRHSRNSRKHVYEGKQASYGTVRERIAVGLQQAALLQRIDPGLVSLDDLEPWHIAALYVQCAIRQLKQKTYNRLGVFWRDALLSLGLVAKDFLPARNETILKRLGVTDRYIAGAVDGSFTAARQSAERMIRTFAEEEPAWGAALRLGDALQLRPREMISFHPKEDHNRLTGRSFVCHGPKGGRPRHADHAPDPAYVERAVAEAVPFANRRTGSLIPDHKSRKQWLRRGYYIAEKHGYTKRERGVTLYAFRREGFIAIYQHHAGVPPPISGGSGASEEGDARGRQAVASQGGHSIWRNSDAYLGPSPFLHPQPTRLGIRPSEAERRQLRGPCVRRRRRRRRA